MRGRAAAARELFTVWAPLARILVSSPEAPIVHTLAEQPQLRLLDLNELVRMAAYFRFLLR
jgi:hypothetical protein